MYKCKSCLETLNKDNCFYIYSLNKSNQKKKKRKLRNSNNNEVSSLFLCDICYNKLSSQEKKDYLNNIDNKEPYFILDNIDDIDDIEDKEINDDYDDYDNYYNKNKKKKLNTSDDSDDDSDENNNNNYNYKDENNDEDNNNNYKDKDGFYIPRPPSDSPPTLSHINDEKSNEEENNNNDIVDDEEEEEENNINDEKIKNQNEMFNYLFGMNKGKTPHFIIIEDINKNKNNTDEENNHYDPSYENNQIKNKRKNKNKTKSPTKKDDEEDEETYEFSWLGDDINSINDLIKIGECYEEKKKEKKRYNLNIHKLNKLVKPLKELQKMIGLTNIKDAIFNQIIYYLQDLDNKNTDMLHTVIEGPPGVGKTHICHILAGIYKSLGFLKNNKVVSVKRDDFIAKYLGQTADKTRRKIEEALGGVLFIDEAYSMGDTEGRDSYSKEAIDMLTSYLSEHPHDLICIVAGYKEALQQRFFSQNEGLSRRFTHRFELTDYSPEDLRLIFFKIVEEGDWNILDKDKVPSDFFSKNIKCFKYNGGDMLTLFGYCKKTHSKRLLKIAKEEKILLENKKKLNLEDIEGGLTLFLKNPEYAKRLEEDDSHMGLYT